MNNPASRKALAAALGIALVSGACATQTPASPPQPSPYPGPPASLPDFGAASEGQCHPGVAALVGAAIGAIIYEDDRGRGAVVGAGLGALACTIINTASKPTRSPQQVEGEYKSQHGKLPAQPQVIAYRSSFGPEGGVPAGEEAVIVSDLAVVAGTQEPVREVKEVVEILNPADRREVLVKVDKVTEMPPGGGGTQNTFRIRLPQGMAQGSYPVRSSVFVNGRLLEENRGTLRVTGPRPA